MSLKSRIGFVGSIGTVAVVLLLLFGMRAATTSIVEQNVATYLTAYADVLVPAIDIVDGRPQIDTGNPVIRRIPRDWQISQRGQAIDRSATLRRALPIQSAANSRFRAIDSDGRAIEVMQRAYQFPNAVEVQVSFGLSTEIVTAYEHEQRAQIAARLRPVWITVGVLSVLLLVAQILAVVLPLRRVAQDLDRLQRGELAHLPKNSPHEIVALSQRINALLERNAATLGRYRQFASNMAHAIKTPLTALRASIDSDVSRQHLDQIDALVERNLARARIAGPATVGGTRLPIMPLLERLQRSYQKLFDIPIVVSGHADLALVADSEDLTEALGNLLENACRHAKSSVTIDAAVGRLCVEDDGPGIEPALREQVMQRGARLDEAAAGSGIGLTVAAEIIDLYGGALALGVADLGGLRVEITLPGLAMPTKASKF